MRSKISGLLSALLGTLTGFFIYVLINKEDILTYGQSNFKVVVRDFGGVFVGSQEHSEYVPVDCYPNKTDSELCQTVRPSPRRSSEPCVWSKNDSGLHMVETSKISLDVVAKTMPSVGLGGAWSPDTCQPRAKVAIVIPFRDREDHLPMLLRYLHPMLTRQQLQYRIFVIEQEQGSPFNRGKLMNVGFEESQKYDQYDCVVFHDVDLIPENDNIDYGCPSSPQHLSCAVSTMNYVLLYEALFGGVEMFTRDHFRLVNGFPNTYWGWGGEDDDLYRRIRNQGLQLKRPPMSVGRYTMAKHTKANRSPNVDQHLSKSADRFHTDGLNSLQYSVVWREDRQLHTRISVNLKYGSL